MIKQEPRMNLKDIFGWFFIALGLILFLTLLHIFSIESAGNVSTVMTSTFTIFLRVFGALLTIGMAYIIINFLKWLVWSISTPKWMKQKINNQKEFGNG